MTAKYTNQKCVNEAAYLPLNNPSEIDSVQIIEYSHKMSIQPTYLVPARKLLYTVIDAPGIGIKTKHIEC